MTFQRTTKIYATEESLDIYFGSTTGTPIYSEDAVLLTSNKVYNPTNHCLAYGTYIAQLGDRYGDGWSDGSNLSIKQDGVEIARITWTCGTSQTKFCSQLFTIEAPPEWQYSASVQTSSSWTTGDLDWPSYAGNYPAPTTTVRYFRRSIQITGNDNFGLYVSVITDAGALVYVNGHELVRWNLPTGSITSSTQGTVSTSTKHNFVQLLAVLPAPEDNTYIIAVEVHAGSSIPSSEVFTCSVMFLNADYRLIDSDGSYECIPDNTSQSSQDGSKLFDNNVSTKWSTAVTSASFPTTAIWTIGNEDRLILNKYGLTSANDSPDRDCVSWKILGSNDGSHWDTLDIQTNVEWAARYQTQYFEMNNYVAYNKYKWECEAVSNLTGNMGGFIQAAEWNLLFSSVAYVPPGFSYPQDYYSWSVGVDIVNITPGKSGYTNWQISGAGGASLPTGLSFDSTSGTITGVPTQGLEETVFTVSATYSMDSQVYTCSIMIEVVSCDLPNYISVLVEKVNYNIASETWKIKNSEGVSVLASSSTESFVATCLPIGEYTVIMTSSPGTTWQSNSLMTINVQADGHSFILAKTRLAILDEDSFALSIMLPLPPASVGFFKYLADGTVPENWYASSFSDSTWTTLDASDRPTTSQKVKLFRATFNVASKEGAQGFELYLKARNGVLAYLNGEEIYRSYLEAGDITAESIPTGGSDVYNWRRVTGAITHINTGSNTIAVAVLTQGSADTEIEFDMHLRLLKDSHIHARYWDYSTAGTASGEVDKLFDMDPSTYIYVNKTVASTQKFIIQFANNGAEMFNNYCFVTSSKSNTYDPREWSIEGSMDGQTFTELKSESEVYFESRSKEYCFYMPSNNKAWTYYQLTLKKARVDDATNYYALADWNLYLKDYSSLEIPKLSFSSKVLTGYSGVKITGWACSSSSSSSSSYSTFSISPKLPSGLSFSTTTGKITGTPTELIAPTTYTITAMNPMGEEKRSTVTLSILECAGDMIPITIELTFETKASTFSFVLKDRDAGEIVEERSNFADYSSVSIPVCLSAKIYTLVLKNTQPSTMYYNNMAVVKLDDGRILVSEMFPSVLGEKENNFNPAYSVHPQSTQWNYLVDGTAAPSGWNTLSGAPSSWETERPGQFPVASGVTQYYYTKFQITDLTEFSTLDIAVNVKAGVIVYLNGKEIRRYNLPENTEVNADTAATTESSEPFWLVTGEAVQRECLIVGENILAFELHRFEANEQTNSFDGSAILILDNTNMWMDGTGTTNPVTTGSNGSNEVFDGDPQTKFLSIPGICEGVELIWSWNNDRREPISSYSLVSGNDCNNRHPSGWTLFGSNDGEKWVVLQSKTGQMFTSYMQQKWYNMYNMIPYNRYKLIVTECNNFETTMNCDNWGATKRFQLTDFYMFTKLIPFTEYCRPEGDFEGVANGDTAYADCPNYYEGTRSRYCSEGAFMEEVFACYLLSPQGINYGKTTLELVQNKEVNIVPEILGAEVTVTSDPTLPAGLNLVPSTGAITGKPTTVQESKKYMIIVTNQAGSTNSMIEIAVIEAPPVNISMIILIIVVVIIVILVIVVLIVSMNKKKSGGRRSLPKSAKSDKAPASKPAQVDI